MMPCCLCKPWEGGVELWQTTTEVLDLLHYWTLAPVPRIQCQGRVNNHRKSHLPKDFPPHQSPSPPQTWEFHESWLHWSDYLDKEDLEFSVRYHYRVRWSIPTSRKPIPRATACVYFLIEISKIKPTTLPVEVFYVLESNRYIHRPGKSRFREKWLKDIIESKIILMNSIGF
ncbi:A-kinase anchor protein 14 isoform X1 [Monodelphis domestica]|uniref:A-kinase anchor protein 14 isoform X1 n=1 Tax=Monodelphis domestica TaxID=13616 RepID=UPI0024E204AB|nr:A-kinase anchor protein 14 isoform X1 [Monodelphis domestica]